MKNVKFWMVQIAMVAILSLVFGSPVFADPSSTAVETRQGSQSENASQQGKENSNPNAKGFGDAVAEVTAEENEPVCTGYWNGECVSWE